MADAKDFTLYSGGLKGAESEFGRCAERWGAREVTYSFEGHVMEREKNVKVLSEDELRLGDVSMEIVCKRMGRRYGNAEKIRRVMQSIFHIINSGHDVFVVGRIMDDGTVKGGTGWGVELAKFFNRPLYVYDQEKESWFAWSGVEWKTAEPVISSRTYAGTGTRYLNDAGRQAIEDLYRRSFGEA